ncbi:DUF1330 domain-containing protein [Thalassobius sp. S69A]|uniref:DUF1330 domain-containing protein n=1 Tax=unclassified Thalassovita TaxID=2619711 RepID=UPI003C7D1E4D
MPVLNFSYAEIKDTQKFREYVSAAAALMTQHNVEVVVRGEFERTMQGSEKTPHIAAVFRYPSMEAAQAFYGSPEYQAIVPLRDAACTMTIHFYRE